MNKNTLDVMFSKKSDNWETPQDFYDGLNKEYHFTLDPCAIKENAKCPKFYTIEDDGLIQNWKDEIVFVNPPYGDISSWVSKCYYEYTLYNATVILLIPARTDTKYFQEYCLRCTSLGFVEGRLTFGNCESPAPFPSVIVVFDPKEKDKTQKLFRINRRGIRI
jgi:site-specific DNA-methyltransferase (adenine-specific)